MDNNFSADFPNGLWIGQYGSAPGSSSDFGDEFDSATDIQNFLPASGTPGSLTSSNLDPTTTAAGELAGQVAALALNIQFDESDPATFGKQSCGTSTCYLKDLVVADSTSPCYGWSLATVLSTANNVLAGETNSISASGINSCVSNINENFDNGTTNSGFLDLPN